MALTCARNHCGPLAAASPHNLSKVSCQITVVYFPYLSKGNVSYFTSPMDSKGRAEPRSQGEDLKKRDPGNEVGQLRKRHYLITRLLQLTLGVYYRQHDLNQFIQEPGFTAHTGRETDAPLIGLTRRQLVLAIFEFCTLGFILC